MSDTSVGAERYWGVPDSSRRDPPAEPASARSLADAVSALRKATDSLKDSSVARESSEAPLPASGGSAEDERAVYYRHLEERGALQDVDEETDLESLPSAVTHVRYPDGRVERVGYN
jgi:hypothetical protein